MRGTVCAWNDRRTVKHFSALVLTKAPVVSRNTHQVIEYAMHIVLSHIDDSVKLLSYREGQQFPQRIYHTVVQVVGSTSAHRYVVDFDNQKQTSTALSCSISAVP